jgi:hypothetical protein
LTGYFFGQKSLFTKALFWAIFGQTWAHFSIKCLVTLNRLRGNGNGAISAPAEAGS